MVNVPLMSDRLALRFVGSYVDRDGFVDQVDLGTPTFDVKTNVNTEETTSWRAILGYTGERFNADLMYKYQEIKLGGSNSVMPETAKAAAAFGIIADEYTQFTYGDTSNSNETNEVVLDMNWDLGGSTLTSLTSMSDVALRSSVVILGFDYRSTLLNDYDAFSQELRLSSTGGDRFDWTIGAYYRETERDVDTAGILLNVSQDSVSLFGQLYWYINDAFTATFGLRYENLDSDQVATFEDYGVIGETARGSWSEVSPKVTLDWKLRDELMFYGTVAKGYRAGGLNIDFASALGLPPEILLPIEPFSDTYDPDQVWNYEIGMKSSWLDNRMTLNVALFSIDWSDYQTEGDLVLGGAGLGYTINSGDARSNGVEVDLTLMPAEGWLVTLGGSHVDPTLESGAFKGNQLANAPENLFNASVEYSWPIGNWEAYVYGGYSWRDESYGDVVNGDDPDVPPVGLNRSDSYAIGNLRAGLRGEHWSVQGFVENVSNEYGSSFTFQSGTGFALLDGTGFETISLITPRTYGVNVSYRF
jgi:iron complex outermembrane receptor protein